MSVRAFVSGATGFLGRHLVRELVAGRGWDVSALVRHPARARVLPEGVTLVRGDLDDEGALGEAVRGAEVVFHLGAATAGPWEVHRRATVEGTRRLLRVSAAARVRRFVHVSSLAVYDKRGLSPGRAIDEEWPTVAPEPAAGPYARGKVEAEALVRRAQADGLETVVVRPGLIYGPGRVVFPNLPHLGAVVGGRFVAVGGGDLLLPLVHVDAVVDALVRVATSPLAAGKTYHVVDEDQTTRREYLRLLEELTGHRHRGVYLPVGPVAALFGGVAAARRLTGGASRLPDVSPEKVRMRTVEARYDTSKLAADTGWRPGPPLREGLARSLGVHGRGPKVAVQRVGLIGAGTIAAFHIQALRWLPGVRITGILDADPAAAAAAAARFGLPAHFTDVERFYAEADPQIVHVLTPPQTHAEVVLDALRRGVHALVEKPAAITVAECERMSAAAQAGGLTVGVDENFVLDPLVQEALALISRGAIGDLVHITAFLGFDARRTRHLAPGRAEPSWLSRLPGGPLEDLLPHPLSVTRALAGRELRPVSWRAASTGRLPYEFADELRLSLAGGDDLTADLAISLSARPDDFVVTVHGTRATVRIDLQNMLLDVSRIGPGPKAVARGARVVSSGLRTLTQTARNVLLIATRRALPPGSPLHLIRAHYAALAAGREPPAPLSRASEAVGIARTIWPLPSPPPDG